MNANMLHNWDKWAEVARRIESHLFYFIFVLDVCTGAYLRGYNCMILLIDLCVWYTVLQGLSLIIFGFGGGEETQGFSEGAVPKKKINTKVKRTTLILKGFGSGWSAGSLTGAFLSLKQEAVVRQAVQIELHNSWSWKLLGKNLKQRYL